MAIRSLFAVDFDIYNNKSKGKTNLSIVWLSFIVIFKWLGKTKFVLNIKVHVHPNWVDIWRRNHQEDETFQMHCISGSLSNGRVVINFLKFGKSYLHPLVGICQNDITYSIISCSNLLQFVILSFSKCTLLEVARSCLCR